MESPLVHKLHGGGFRKNTMILEQESLFKKGIISMQNRREMEQDDDIDISR